VIFNSVEENYADPSRHFSLKGAWNAAKAKVSSAVTAVKSSNKCGQYSDRKKKHCHKSRKHFPGDHPEPEFTTLSHKTEEYTEKPGRTGARRNDWYADISEDGTQTWVRVRNGVIDNAGVNNVPRTWDPETGLYNDTKK